VLLKTRLCGVGQATTGQHNQVKEPPGSIGAGFILPARVFKEMKVAVEWGTDRVTVSKLWREY